MAACGHRCGLRWMEASTNEFDWRWTVRALRSAGIIPQWVRHYNLALIDEVWDLSEALFDGGGELTLPGWHRTRLMTRPLLRHGFDYGLEALERKEASTAASAACSMSEAEWLGARLGSPRPIRTERSAADVDALMAEGTSATAEALSAVALDRGLYLSLSDATGFNEAVVADERARALLDEQGYRELQQSLRRCASKAPTAPALMLGRTSGTDALPGPHPSMSEADRNPAQLSSASENEEEEEARPTPNAPNANSDTPQQPAAPAGKQPCPHCGALFGKQLKNHMKRCEGVPPDQVKLQKQRDRREAQKRAREE